MSAPAKSLPRALVPVGDKTNSPSCTTTGSGLVGVRSVTTTQRLRNVTHDLMIVVAVAREMAHDVLGQGFVGVEATDWAEVEDQRD